MNSRAEAQSTRWAPRRGAVLACGLLTFAALLGGGCAGEGSATPRAAVVSAAPEADAPAVLAAIDGEQITMDDVRALSGTQLERLETDYLRSQHEAIELALRQILQERLLEPEARSLGMSVEDLIREEAGGSLDPSAQDIASWYEQNPDRVGGRPLAQVSSAIAQFIRNDRRQAAVRSLERRLGEARGLAVFLEPFRVRLDNEGAPSRGSVDAPVTLVEFSDFQCPFCRGFSSTLEQVAEEFEDEVRIVYRHFPLNIHPQAMKAAEASQCAEGQGKFWEFHDLLFAEQDRLQVDDLRDKASRLGLDRTQFDDCLDRGQSIQHVRADMLEARRVGVTGTPELFVNGIALDPGNIPFDVVAAAIRAELERIGR